MSLCLRRLAERAGEAPDRQSSPHNNPSLRRTDNIFKQLDERSLTEAEERIIQQRVRVVFCAVGLLLVSAVCTR